MTREGHERVLAYLRQNGESRVVDILHHLQISKQALHKQLASLISSGQIQKRGKAPKVFYSLTKVSTQSEQVEAVEPALEKFVNEHYLNVTPDGRKLHGLEGFKVWCAKHKLPLEKTAREYRQTLGPYLKLRKNNLLDGTKKIAGTFEKMWLDKLYYIDFYSTPRFGKTKLGQLVLYAKQSQDRKIIAELIAEIRTNILKVIKRGRYDAIGLVPPSVKREVQLMRELERGLQTGSPVLKIEKISTPVRVPQKSLNKLADRIENAKATFVVTDKNRFSKVLLIDDAVGSGATMNEIAAKIKGRGVAKIVNGLAIVGSLKGFDVISEV